MPSRKKPPTYPIGLTPTPSPLCPHCLVHERLCLWWPLLSRNTLNTQGYPSNLAAADLARIEEVIINAWAESTQESYSASLLAFHVFCDSKLVSETQRAPVTQVILSSFVAAMSGSYSGRTMANYVHGIRAWHILHGVPWRLKGNELDALLKASNNLTPKTSKHRKCHPYTISFLESVRAQLNLDDPTDAAVFACLTLTFFATARVGQTTVRRLDVFNPNLHVKHSDVSEVQDHNELPSMNVHIPRTKSSPEGEDISFSPQNGPSDPKAALENHFRVNDPLPNTHLFAYKYNGSHCLLTRQTFLRVVSQTAWAAGLEPFQGHCIHIGSTLEYLLRGVPFNIMKVKGHWASNAFLLYLQKHTQILTPYMQATPQVHESFVHFTMPPVQ